jgi:hypothetical protein
VARVRCTEVQQERPAALSDLDHDRRRTEQSTLSIEHDFMLDNLDHDNVPANQHV